jgi:dihydrofolate reductase
MSRLIASSISISADGFGAGPGQSLEHPLGIGGMAVHDWVFPTRTFKRMHGGGEDGEEGIDEAFAARGFRDVGAWILGRNMFAPSRGPWPDDGWKGWWGDDPPYHVPAYVLTHHPRAPLEMAGGTTFHFVTGGIHEALSLARASAGAKDVRVGGGVATLREYLAARLLDALHVAISPVLLGQGEALFAGLDLPALGYRVTEHARGERATHLVISRER